MTRRSAPFVLPPFASEANINDTLTTDDKKLAKDLLSTLQADIAKMREEQIPPDILTQVQDMPIFYGNLEEVTAYQQRWQPLIDRAMAFYPSAYLPPDYLPLPASLELPQFVQRVQRLHLTKTRAKESKNFGSLGALIHKCGEYPEAQVLAMQRVFDCDDDVHLVAHREFIDLRAYVFAKDHKGKELDPVRMRFYRTGLIVHALDGFEIIDSRKKPRKRRNDAYTNPIADNGVWKVFVKNQTLN